MNAEHQRQLNAKFACAVKIVWISLILSVCATWPQLASPIQAASRLIISGTYDCGTQDCSFGDYTFLRHDKNCEPIGNCGWNEPCIITADVENNNQITKILAAKPVKGKFVPEVGIFVKLTSCDFDKKTDKIWIHGSDNQYEEIIFTSDNVKNNLCSKINTGKRYLLYFNDWDEDGPDCPYAKLEKIVDLKN